MTAARELRLVLTVEDVDAALAFYRDALGLEQLDAWASEEGCGAILAAGDATIELIDADQAETIDGIEVGRRVAGPVRLALEVADSEATAERLTKAGAERLGGPRRDALEASKCPPGCARRSAADALHRSRRIGRCRQKAPSPANPRAHRT